MIRLIAVLFILTLFGCKSPEARYPITQSSGSFIKASAERNIRLNAKEDKRIKSVIAEQSDQDYLASENGFYYTYLIKNENDTITPQFGDLVNFNYEIKDLNGNTIYSEEELQTQSYAMDQQEIFTGLREGLKLMKAGETVTFLFPSQMAYGYYGDENKIGTNVPLMCKVKVNSINKKETN